MPAHPRQEVTASAHHWLQLLDAVADGEVRVVFCTSSGSRAVLLSEEELQRLEDDAQRSREVQVVLTPRERDVLLLVERGSSTAGIAEALGVAPGTVVQHLAAARRKYGVRSSGEAASRAREAGDLG
ncbi:response regulator transcription factor [Quadrisphaera setariae]|uniref:Helix-turn-helix transcriptional regulator n=1 Tax=Quadrisphaera setariae TaxID=2593304 RepID=A0A5C8ZDC9_9ACTN|nr:helix-turn-helix transcriptional regulator [Quadrisphaera setariae]TXR56095.1 helix-turn-helix transcriptional regulator [Quadrisphaera setariae]